MSAPPGNGVTYSIKELLEEIHSDIQHLHLCLETRCNALEARMIRLEQTLAIGRWALGLLVVILAGVISMFQFDVLRITGR